MSSTRGKRIAIGVPLANPRLGVRVRRRTRTDGDAFAAVLAHVGHRSSSSTSAVISRAAALSGAVSRARRPAATLSFRRWRSQLRAALRGLHGLRRHGAVLG